MGNETRGWPQALVATVLFFLLPSPLYADADDLITAALHNKALAQRLQRAGLQSQPSRDVSPWASRLGRMSVPRRTEGRPYEAHIREAARRYGVDPHLIRAVIEVESGRDPHALSAAGARGLMQVMPQTARTLGVHPYLLWDERTNVLTGTRYLRDQLETFGNVRDALIAYNSGPDTVLLGKPLPAETKAYVPKVLERYRAYRVAQK